MNNDTKIKIIGAKKAPTPLTVEALLHFAERVIRTDKEAALRSQKNQPDLAQPSNDRTAPASSTPKISALSELANKKGLIKIKNLNDDENEDEALSRVVQLPRHPGKS
jgi:hypothetical protein